MKTCIYDSMGSCGNSTSNAGSNFHEAKPSKISCITSAINVIPQLTVLSYVNTIVSPVHSLLYLKVLQ